MKRRDEVLVGIVSTAALVMGFIGALWLARGGLAPGYPLYTKFNWGAGLRSGQPVLLAGVNVGFVDEVSFNTDGKLVVTMRVRNSYHVPKGTTATIEPNGFFGDVLVALHPSAPTPEIFASGDTVPAGKAAPSVSDVLFRMDTLASNLSVLSASFRKELVDEKGLAEFRGALTRAKEMFAEIQRVAAEQNTEFTRTQASLRRAASAIDSARIDSTLRALGDAGSQVKALTAEFGRTSAHLDSLLEKVNHGGGSLSKALNDPGMYDDTRHAIQRLDSLMTEFQKNPRKFIKLSIF